SLVPVCPSTLMQLNDWSAATGASAARSAASMGASVSTNASSVAMLGPIIAAPLAKPVIRYSFSARVRIFTRVSVVRMARAARSRRGRLAARLPGRAGYARLHGRHRQQPADHAGRADEHPFRIHADRLGGDGGHAAGVRESLLAGAGVGVARADDDAAHAL